MIINTVIASVLTVWCEPLQPETSHVFGPLLASFIGREEGGEGGGGGGGVLCVSSFWPTY